MLINAGFGLALLSVLAGYIVSSAAGGKALGCGILALLAAGGGFLAVVGSLVSALADRLPESTPRRMIVVSAYMFFVAGVVFEFGAFYQWLASRDPHAFSILHLNQANDFYFTIGVFSTSGSSILPQSSAARVAVAAQQIVDLVMIAIGLAILLVKATESIERHR